MNENTTADTSVNATAIDDETLSRAVLTYCLDSADAMMYALVKGIGSATHTLQLLADSGPGNHESVATAAYKTLDAALINGITRWGRTINARGMASFHGAMVSWQHRLTHCPAPTPRSSKRGSPQTARSGSSRRITPTGLRSLPTSPYTRTGPRHYAYGGKVTPKRWCHAPNRSVSSDHAA